MRDSGERERIEFRELVSWQRDVPRKYLVGQFLFFWLWVGITVFGIILTPSSVGHGTHQQLGLPPCAAVLMFGRPCPGCGLTTSWTATLHGKLTQAFSAHALGPVLYLGFTVGALICGYGFVKGWRWRSESRTLSMVLLIALGVFITYGLVRWFTTRMYYSPEIPLGR
ncbi:MAG: DUF2752 domain-containing protein [Chthonomonas sp.]|nr:DUF2752 domain-containing protein [Chthonomonas sp.]